MKKKILSFVLAFCLIVPAICMFSACGEKLYDIEITTNTSIDHIQEIKFASSSTKTTTYRNSEDTYIEVICDQGFAPDLEFSVSDMVINEYDDYFGEIYDYTADPATVTGVRYAYTVPTKDLTGKQTVTYRGSTKTAKIRLTFNLDKGGDEVNPFDRDYEGMSFEFKGLADSQTRIFTAKAFIEFANGNQYLMLDYNQPMTITFKSNRPVNLFVSMLFYVYERYSGGDDETDWNGYYRWTVKSDINFDLLLNLGRLREAYPQEENV